MANLYALSTELKSLYERALENVDEETGEVDAKILEMLDTTKKDFEEKAINVATFYRAVQSELERYDMETARMLAEAAKLKKLADRIKNNLSNALLSTGTEKLEGLHAKVSFRASKSTVIDNEDLIPDEYKKARLVYTIDKVKIKEAILQGEIVNGAHVEDNKNIQIK